MFEIIRNMYELQKIEMGVEKIVFPCFYNFAFCSLTDEQNIYRIDADILKECAKKNSFCFN